MKHSDAKGDAAMPAGSENLGLYRWKVRGTISYRTTRQIDLIVILPFPPQFYGTVAQPDRIHYGDLLEEDLAALLDDTLHLKEVAFEPDNYGVEFLGEETRQESEDRLRPQALPLLDVLLARPAAPTLIHNEVARLVQVLTGTTVEQFFGGPVVWPEQREALR